MNDSVWKYLVGPGPTVIQMPVGAKPLTVQIQAGMRCLWALVDPTAAQEPRVFEFHGTGHDSVRPGSIYIGTIQEPPFVWHLFEAPR